MNRLLPNPFCGENETIYKMRKREENTDMDRKALFFDIDGTLLSEITGEVPESAVKALEQARSRGHLTFINTGRTIAALPPVLKKMPFSGFLCGCGTYIEYQEKVLLAQTIPHQRGREIIRLVQEYGADLILEGQEDCYVSIHRSRFERIENTRRYFRSMGLGVETYAENDNFDYDKLVVYVDEQTDKERLLLELGKDMDLMDRREGFYEVVPKGYSKATAIEYILKHFHITPRDAYVFGDSSNDLSMFRYARHAVAMGHHDPVLEPYTEFVTKTVEEDGLELAMKHYGLIE